MPKQKVNQKLPNAKSGKFNKQNLKRDVKFNAKRNNYQDAFADEEKLKDSRKYPNKRVPSSASDNDPTWYYKDKTVLDSVSSFSFNNPLGSYLNMKLMFPGNDTSGLMTSIPGLMTMTIAPSPGISIDAQSPVNIGAQNVYSFVRYKNSGSKNYDAPDLMMYLLAMDSIYSCWNWMKRIYGMASTYSAMNRYKPAAYLAANYVDLDDVYAHIADFRGYLNLAADRISAFCVPAVFNYMVRHAWLFSNIYRDSETTKAQEYMYVPAYFYKYDETSVPHGGILTPINICLTKPDVLYKVTDLMSLLNSMLNALEYSEDIGVMSGDVLKAYESGNLFKLGHFEPDYCVDSVYSKEVLTQFENAIYYPNPNYISGSLTSLNITQDPNTNFIKFQPVFTGASANIQGNYLNFHWNNPTPEDVIVATRINVSMTTESGNTTITDCGSELGFKCSVYTYIQSEDISSVGAVSTSQYLSSFDMSSLGFIYGEAMDKATITNIIQVLQAQSAFDWCPCTIAAVKSSTNVTNILPLFRDWDNYTYISEENYRALNSLALNSMFNVPN